jgi:DNA adenine methylase
MQREVLRLRGLAELVTEQNTRKQLIRYPLMERRCFENLKAVSAVLRREGIEILCEDNQEVVEDSRAGNFIYFDPPYQPVSSTSHFTAYTKQSFTMQDQQRLAEAFRQLDSRGCLLMLSNSPKVRDLYRGYQVVDLKATRAISCVGSGRGRVEELLVVNYDRGDSAESGLA